MVLIDMEMPDCCEKCPFLDYEQGYCFASSKKGKDGWYECDLYAGGNENKRHADCPLKPFTPPESQITTNIYDTEEIHHNCTVHILSNSVTGDVSVGWWKEKEEEEE